MTTIRATLLAGTIVRLALGQTPALTNASLQGKYFFRQLMFSTDTVGNIVDTRAALGTIVFDGRGSYAVNGSVTVGAFAAAPLASSGAYSLNSPGTVTMTNPLNTGLILNGRAGNEAIVASTTDSGTNTFDLLAAIPAPATAQSNAALSGNFWVSTLEFPNGVGNGARSALFNLPANGNGLFSNFTVTGHSLNISGGALQSTTIAGANYAMASDGSGTAFFGSAANALNGTKSIFVSASGNVILGGSPLAGAQDFLIGVRAYSGTPSAANVFGLYWTGGLRFDAKNPSTASYAGALNGLGSLGRVVSSDRLHQLGLGGFDYTREIDLTSGTTGNFTVLLSQMGLGSGGDLFVQTNLSSADPMGFSLDVGVRAPALSGTGVYLQPQGIVNAASLAPIGQSIAPGEFLSLFGSGLAGDQSAAKPPYPTVLGGASVTVAGLPAPVAYSSPTQLNILVPYGVAAGSAAIIVTNNGTASNTVTVPVQTTAPGVFSADGSGTGDGAITHANGTLVSKSSPARRGETVTIYLGGLGAVTPAVGDGQPAGSTLTSLNAKLAVLVNATPLTIAFVGLSPAFPGLYQINATIPNGVIGSGALPLAIQTVDSFHCQVNLELQ